MDGTNPVGIGLIEWSKIGNSSAFQQNSNIDGHEDEAVKNISTNSRLQTVIVRAVSIALAL